jgi:hypothetical protein
LEHRQPTAPEGWRHHASRRSSCASTQQILELGDHGLTWSEMAKQVDMTVSDAGAATGESGRPSLHAWAVGSRFSPTRSIKTLRLAYEQPSLIIFLVDPRPGLN